MGSPSASRASRRASIVEVVRELRIEASLGALRVLEEAERLGVPRRVANGLVDKVMIYELTLKEALVRLRELAAQHGAREGG